MGYRSIRKIRKFSCNSHNRKKTKRKLEKSLLSVVRNLSRIPRLSLFLMFNFKTVFVFKNSLTKNFDYRKVIYFIQNLIFLKFLLRSASSASAVLSSIIIVLLLYLLSNSSWIAGPLKQFSCIIASSSAIRQRTMIQQLMTASYLHIDTVACSSGGNAGAKGAGCNRSS